MLIFEESVGLANPDLPEGATAAVDAVNASGGIGGRPLELIVCDTRNDPNVAADCANQAVEAGAIASVGNISQQTAAYYPIFEAETIPVIAESPSTIEAFISPSSFPAQGGAASSFAALARFVVDAGATSIAVVRPDVAAAAQAKVFADLGLASVGTAVQSDVAVPLDAPDMAQYAAQAMAGGIDGLVVALVGSQAQNFVQAARQIDPDVRIGLISSNQDDVVEALGDDAAGIIVADYLLPPTVDAAGTQQYVSEMEAAGFDTGGTRQLGWFAVHLFATLANQLAADGTELTGESLTALLEATTGLETGLTPPLQWTTGGGGGLPRLFNTCMIAAQFGDDGTSSVTTGTFFDPFTGADCETPT